MIGAPSQLDLFDHKPELVKRDGEHCPDSLLAGKRFAFIGGRDEARRLEVCQFAPHGQSGQSPLGAAAPTSRGWPMISRWCDRCTPRRSITRRRRCFCTPASDAAAGRALARGSRTGSARRIRTCPPTWCCSPARPAARAPACGRAAFCRASTRACSSARKATPCFTSRTPPGHGTDKPPPRARCGRARSTKRNSPNVGDPEIATRISQYEMAYRMQTSVPELMDISRGARRRRSSSTARSPARPLSPTTACSRGG